MVRIITDSSADLEPIEYETLGVTCIPLTVVFGDKEYQENISLSKEQFYKLLEENDEFPHTSQPSPEYVVNLLKEIKERGDEAVVIPLSSGFSGTYQSMLMAKELAEFDNCYVVDSLNGTGGQRMLVEYAVKLRDQGKSAKEIAEGVESIRSRVVLFACIDTLEYLHKGGRISHATYKIANFAKIKPIITVSPEGRIEVPAKSIGMKKGMAFLCEKVVSITPDEAFPLYVMYTGNRTNGEKLARRLGEQGCDVPEERIINVGAAIGSHIGSNACGLVYIAK